VRVVLDSQLRLPLEGEIAATARQNPVWLITGNQATSAERREALTALGVEILRVDADTAGRPAINAVLNSLAARGITRLLVEGGGEVLSAFLRCNVVDRLVWFRAGSVIGGDGLASVAPMGVDDLAQLRRFRRESVAPLGADIMETYVMAPETS
jgi:diaminohydroxyphosphoribosylaminopyrimidine deaminase/5-amino-6-(5-phosphoribosylamino)uracil reductase